jgi:hypothetical protein
MEKMRPTDTTPGIGGGKLKRMAERVNSSTMYLIYCRNFCKCHNVSPSKVIKYLKK